MKKLMFLAAVLLTAGAASAQITYSLGYINTSTETKALVNHTESMNGFTISVDDNINLAGDLNVAPGVGMDVSFKKDGNLKYKKVGLYVPVDFNYGIALGSDLKLFIFAGPTFDLGILNDYKNGNGDKINNFDNNLKRFDLLLGGGAWLTFQDQLRFKVGYKAGMLNTSKIDNVTVKNNVLSVSVGYIF